MNKTHKLGIIGWPLGYSLSPTMHNAALKAAGLSGEYREIPVGPEALAQWLEREAPKLDGFNVTMPHKEAVFAWLKKHGVVDQAIEWIGAVNTVKVEQGRLIGEDTDGKGFYEPLLRRFGQKCFKGKRVFLLGAGGAAKAIALSVIAEGGAALLSVWNRTPDRAEHLVEHLRKGFGRYHREWPVVVEKDLKKGFSEADWVINATSCEMNGKPALPISAKELRKEQVVYDIVYQPRETALIRAARERGCTVITGDEMLAAQGNLAFQIWFGEDLRKRHDAVEISVEKLMWKVLDEALSGQEVSE